MHYFRQPILFFWTLVLTAAVALFTVSLIQGHRHPNSMKSIPYQAMSTNAITSIRIELAQLPDLPSYNIDGWVHSFDSTISSDLAVPVNAASKNYLNELLATSNELIAAQSSAQAGKIKQQLYEIGDNLIKLELR